jgi:hypothetical protein
VLMIEIGMEEILSWTRSSGWKWNIINKNI